MKRMTAWILALLLSLTGFIGAPVFARAEEVLDPEAPPPLMTTQERVPDVNSRKSLSYFLEFRNKQEDDAQDDSFIIPGLNRTVTYSSEKKYHEADTMVPQGMCRVGIYVLISAYDSRDEAKSVIYVLNKERQLIKTLILPSSNHVGGLAYDKERQMVLVARSAHAGLSAISWNDLKQYIKDERSYLRIPYTVSLSVPEVKAPCASGLTYYNGRVYIFSCGTGAGSVCCCYTPTYDAENNLYQLNYHYRFQLPNFVQGVTLTKYGKKTRLFVSVSYGRSEKLSTYVSNLYTYVFNEETGEKTPDNILACPPMLEQTFAYEGRLYCLFECASKQYRAVNLSPVDQVVALSIPRLCDEKKGSIINLKAEAAIGGKRVSAELTQEKLKPYASIYYVPYYSYDRVVPNAPLKPYIAEESETVYAVAVYKDRIVACDVISFTVKQLTAPKKPLRISRTQEQVRLKWSRSKGAQGYYVYRSTKKNGTYKRVARVTKRSYTDKKAKPNKRYYYRIAAYRKGYKTSALSAPLRFKALPQPEEENG